MQTEGTPPHPPHTWKGVPEEGCEELLQEARLMDHIICQVGLLRVSGQIAAEGGCTGRDVEQLRAGSRAFLAFLQTPFPFQISAQKGSLCSAG